ncbi:MAG: hypothetical protein ABSC55_08440 [Syntrophorhabdales bacterium]|jgi:hypothetical protein
MDSSSQIGLFATEDSNIVRPGSMAERLRKEEEELRVKCKSFVLGWVREKQGSETEFVSELENALGWKSRHYILSVLDELRCDKKIPLIDRNYLSNTLTDEAVQSVFDEGGRPNKEEQSSLDELFHRSKEARLSTKFAEAVAFAAKFRDYSPFNNMLVYLQNPTTTFFATEKHWSKVFGREVKEDARGMVILAPMTPVLLVYDIEETEGAPLPEKFQGFTRTEGRFDQELLDMTLRNCERDLILVQRKEMGQLHGGFATTRLRNQRYKMRIVVREQLDVGSAYAVLCHELAHIYLGHLGSDKDNWWPYRINLPHRTVEVEAEAASYIVCRRLGLTTHSADYLSVYIRDKKDVEKVSIDLVTRVASRIEEMGKRLQPERKRKSQADTRKEGT